MVVDPKSPCPLCSRMLGDVRISRHHLVPKSKGGRIEEYLHDICHAKVHATFTNNQLEDYYNTAEKLLEHEEIQKFVKWVTKKPIDYYDKNNDTKDRKRKR